MKRPTALVTGGCGFVGRHFVKRLLGSGYVVTVVDDLSTGLALEQWPAHLKPATGEEDRLLYCKGDFREYSKSVPADFDLIVHLAAVVGGRMTIEGDPLAVATDLAIDATFFNWAVKSRPMPRKVLFFSSSAAYPISLQTAEYSVPLAEHMIDFEKKLELPDMTYGWAKLTGEFLAQFAARQYGLDVVCYRPFSGYGEDQDFTYPFPSVIRRVARKESPIVVWGSGKQLRDFIYIEDCIDGIFATMNRMRPGDAMNLGSGVGVSFAQLAVMASGIIGHRAEVINDPTKPEGVFARVADCGRFFQFYKPKTSLEQGIEIVYRYQQRAGLI